MNINDVTAICGVISSILIAVSACAGAAWFVFSGNNQRTLKDEIARKNDEIHQARLKAFANLKAINAATGKEIKLPKRRALYCDDQKEPIAAKVRIQDVGVIAYINE